ncbi:MULTISPECIES: ABC transporter permease [Oscillospiraceae]|uniref:ABC transporter permease n=1 Tax=Lawsonibacter faecis TaxID=2763052 RepID=A0A8J6JDU8_9FIRM|nr:MULTISPECIES: ABC transporter permease [Oscillospiraceae]MTQ97701.1 ABC transporter permease subunit [Pseudoflavonifractor sp. BIOML-A16]MTR06688.1 ABC transporter permease subunit [Pseudoflavonifractor sp. BIOML-A15]MTR33316.1 ABC transporter permease subunit [Pseudoflavonifractor sp. BIOML-A14]MTR73940.1 ABC transporter permease subunit [Pseudoflavonifractor sp. BIOML-A18]MTS64710.1 ABC transporter permease subunit [Pseudoflavonifractor sp. BIOML-A5]MTS72902.1 ABC transporter permease su
MGLVFLFLYAPIFVLIVFSFNATKSRTVWGGFSLDWYAKLFQNTQIMGALYTTLLVSVIAAAIATIAGTAAAIGFYSMKRRPRTLCLSVNNIPMTNADIVTGVSLMLLFVFAGRFLPFKQGFATLLIAHITFDIPYVILSVLPKLRQLDANIYEAAQDLGATGFLAFRKVVLPEIMPGVLNGMLIAFTMSIDDFVISYFTAGSQTSTLAMVIYSMTRRKISPEINALSTLMFLVVLALLLVINIRQANQDKAAKKKADKLAAPGSAALLDTQK